MDFATRLVETFSLFTLPLVPDFLVQDALKVKCLYGLWNTVLDDRIDCDHAGRDYLTDTLGVVYCGFSAGKMHPRSVTGSIMKDILKRFLQFPEGPNTHTAREFFFLDLFRTINAFTYEYITVTNHNIVTFSEYMEFSTSTIDVRCILDIDLALIQDKIHPATVGNLRELYKLFGTIFRLFNDMATLEREVYSESSLNAVILYGIEKGILPRNILYKPDEEKRKIHRESIPQLSQTIEALIEHCKQMAISKISHITEMDLEPMAKTFDLLIESVSRESFVTKAVYT